MTFRNALSRRRGRGYLADSLDSRDFDFDKMGFGSGELPAEVSLRSHVKYVLDQRSTNSCVANAICNAIAIADSKQFGIESPLLVSRLFAYYNARAYHGAQGRDFGTYLRYCIKGLTKFGMPNEEEHPFSVLRVNRRPSWNSYRKAFDRRGPSGYYRIFDVQASRLSAIKASLNNGHPVCFGTGIDNAFFKASGSHVVERPRTADIVGGHAMVWVGYRNKNGGDQFLTLNSWGRGYRDGGFFWMTDDYVTSPETRDLQVIKLKDPTT